MFSVVSLGSGSSGNAFLIRAGGTRVLIDAGLGIRNTLQRLAALGTNPGDLSAIALTHEHTDHSRSALELARRFSVPLAGNRETLEAVIPPGETLRAVCLPAEREHSIEELAIRAFPVLHDGRAPVGYSLSHEGRKVSIAVDLGKVTPRVERELAQAELVIIDCNHDVELLRVSRYPRHLKERIMSPLGHLSNEDAFRVISRHPRRQETVFWLAHLSETNNSPERVAVNFNASFKLNGIKGVRFQILPRHRISEPWSPPDGEQGLLFSGVEHDECQQTSCT